MLSVLLSLVFLGYLFASYPSKAADGDTTSTTSTVIDTSTGSSTSTVVDTTTTTSSNPISTKTEITNTTTTLEDFGGGITEQTTIDTHTTTNVDDETVKATKPYFSERELVEITMMVGMYRMLAGFLNTFAIPMEEVTDNFIEFTTRPKL